MRLLLAVLAMSSVLAFAGCKSGQGKDCDKCTTKMSAVDACSHCEGVQTATADGKCPVCGAKVSKM